MFNIMLIIFYTIIVFLSCIYFFYIIYLKKLQDFHHMELNKLKKEINRLYLEKGFLINSIPLKTENNIYFNLIYKNSLDLQPSKLLLNAIIRSTKAKLKTKELFLSAVIQNVDNNINFININNKIIDLDIKIIELREKIDLLIAVFGPDKITPNTLYMIENIQKNSAALIYRLFLRWFY